MVSECGDRKSCVCARSSSAQLARCVSLQTLVNALVEFADGFHCVQGCRGSFIFVHTFDITVYLAQREGGRNG